MKNKKKILLIGGEGFLGRNISNLLSRKHNCVSVGIEESFFDGARRDEFLKKNPYREKIQGIYNVLVHLIDNDIRQIDFLKEERKLQNNIEFESKAHIIVFSSAAVYANPDSDYAKRKKRLEESYARYCKNKSLALTIIRLFNTFGLYQMPSRPGSLVANIFYNHLSKKPIVINDLDAQRDFIYAGDVANFVGEVVDKRHAGAIDLGSGKLTSVRELLDIIQEEVIKDPVDTKHRNFCETIPSIAARKKFLPAATLTPLKIALKQTFNFYKKNLKIIKKHILL